MYELDYWLKQSSIISMHREKLAFICMNFVIFTLRFVPIVLDYIVELCSPVGWLHRLRVLNTNHTQSDNCVPYCLLGPCLTSLTRDIQGTSG